MYGLKIYTWHVKTVKNKSRKVWKACDFGQRCYRQKGTMVLELPPPPPLAQVRTEINTSNPLTTEPLPYSVHEWQSKAICMLMAGQLIVNLQKLYIKLNFKSNQLILW